MQQLIPDFNPDDCDARGCTAMVMVFMVKLGLLQIESKGNITLFVYTGMAEQYVKRNRKFINESHTRVVQPLPRK